MHVAMTIYANDNDDEYPVWPQARSSERPLSRLVPTYTADTGIFTCPGSDDPALPQGVPFQKGTISYAYYTGWKKTDTGSRPLVSDRQRPLTGGRRRRGERIFSRDGNGPGANHGKYGGNVLFLDGSTRHYESKSDDQLQIPDEIKLLNPRS